MKPARLTNEELKDHLLLEAPGVARLVRGVRRAVLRDAPGAAEAVKFGVLCYYHADAWFGSIGGNICMIEVKDRPKRQGGGREVLLSFIHGALLPDPAGLLRGKGKMKRFLPVPDADFVGRKDVAALIRAARELRPWD